MEIVLGTTGETEAEPRFGKVRMGDCAAWKLSWCQPSLNPFLVSTWRRRTPAFLSFCPPTWHIWNRTSGGGVWEWAESGDERRQRASILSKGESGERAQVCLLPYGDFVSDATQYLGYLCSMLTASDDSVGMKGTRPPLWCTESAESAESG